MNERTEQAMRESFAKKCPEDDVMLRLAEDNQDFWLDAINARHALARFREGWLAAQVSIATPQQTVRDALEIGLLENKLMQAMEGLRRCADPYEKGPRVIAERTLRNIDKTKSAKPHLIEPLSAATGGQESEAQAIAIVDAIEVDPSKRTIKCLSYERLLGISAGTKLYTAPPSTLAIETAALRKAAALVSGNYGWKYGGGSGEYCDDFGDAVLALIPQDGITALERFAIECMSKAVLLVEHDYYPPEEDLLKIVSSLIGENK